MENEKTPLQDEKKEIIDEIINSKNDDVETPKKKRKYTKRKNVKVTKPVIEVPAYSELDADRDSEFLTVFVNEIRAGNGIKPINEKHAVFFQSSSKQMFLKYGATTSRWMPEIMFGGSLTFILFDTYKEILKIRVDQKPEKKTIKPTKKEKFDKDGKQKSNLELK